MNSWAIVGIPVFIYMLKGGSAHTTWFNKNVSTFSKTSEKQSKGPFIDNLRKIFEFFPSSPSSAYANDLSYEIHKTSLTTSTYPWPSSSADVIYGWSLAESSVGEFVTVCTCAYIARSREMLLSEVAAEFISRLRTKSATVQTPGAKMASLIKSQILKHLSK